jgi:hypothetical protein
MTLAASTRTSRRRDPGHRRDGRDVASWPRLWVPTASRPPAERGASSSSVRELRMPPHEPAIPGTGNDEEAVTRRTRVLTGLALVGMGGLLLLASGGHPWARDVVRGAWPLFILAVGFCTVMVVTDRDDVVGKMSVVVGVAIVFVARFGIVPGATLLVLGPWAFVLAGLAIALSGVKLRARQHRRRHGRSGAGPAAPWSSSKRCCQQGGSPPIGSSYSRAPCG